MSAVEKELSHSNAGILYGIYLCLKESIQTKFTHSDYGDIIEYSSSAVSKLKTSYVMSDEPFNRCLIKIDNYCQDEHIDNIFSRLCTIFECPFSNEQLSSKELVVCVKHLQKMLSNMTFIDKHIVHIHKNLETKLSRYSPYLVVEKTPADCKALQRKQQIFSTPLLKEREVLNAEDYREISQLNEWYRAHAFSKDEQ